MQARAMVLFSFPFPRQRGIAVFCDGDALCGRCSCSPAMALLLAHFSWSMLDRLLTQCESEWVGAALGASKVLDEYCSSQGQ